MLEKFKCHSRQLLLDAGAEPARVAVTLPLFSEMREHLLTWSLLDALQFTGRLRVFDWCVQAQKPETAKRLDALLTIYGNCYGLSQEEIAAWRDFTLNTLSDADSYAANLTSRLVSIVNPMVGLPAEAPVSLAGVTWGYAWTMFFEAVLDDFNRRFKDSAWRSHVDSIIRQESLK